MNEEQRKLFWQIINCGKASECTACCSCRREVEQWQDRVGGGRELQLPEPWNGDIEHAQLLIVGNNPAINFEEYFPTSTWRKQDTENFFMNRFGSDEAYVRQKICNGRVRVSLRLVDKWTRFDGRQYWCKTFLYARKILGEEVVRIGDKYALTEAAFCKTPDTNTLPHACCCASLYLPNIFEVSKSLRYVLFLGRLAKSAMADLLCLDKESIEVGRSYNYVSSNGANIELLYDNHPQGGGGSPRNLMITNEL